MHKKKIVIAAMFVEFPSCTSNGSRFYYIAKILKDNGFDVTLITGSFDHIQKLQREMEIDSEVDYKIVYQPSYSTNLSFARIRSMIVFGNNALKLLKEMDYDLLYCSIPDNRMADILAKEAKKRGKKVILDIEDLWPEAMKMVLYGKKYKQIISPVLLPFNLYAKMAYLRVDAYVGTSDEYRDYGSRYDKRNSLKPRKTVYVGNDLEKFDKAIKNTAIKIDKLKFWVTYAGSIGYSYDIKTMIDTAVLLKSRGYGDICIMLLGDGATRRELEEYAGQCDCNVEFLGFQPYENMAFYLAKSDIVVNSLVKQAPQSIVTKIGDYLASGKPMINTGSSKEMRRLVKNNKVGINVVAEDSELLYKAIVKMYKDDALRKEFGNNARKLAEKKFDRKTAYIEINHLVEELV